MAAGAVGWGRTPGGTDPPPGRHVPSEARHVCRPIKNKQWNTIARFNHSLRDSTLHQGNYRNEAANQAGGEGPPFGRFGDDEQ
jgi:hypothetical protein